MAMFLEREYRRDFFKAVAAFFGVGRSGGNPLVKNASANRVPGQPVVMEVVG
jgi:hypothetical protein